MILSSALNVYLHHLPFRAPFDLPGKFRMAIKRRNVPVMTASFGPLHRGRIARIGDLLAVPGFRFRRADLAAVLAYDRNREPVIGARRFGYLFVYLPYRRSIVQSLADDAVHSAGEVEFARAIELGLKSCLMNSLDIVIGKVFGKIRRYGRLG